MPSIFPNDYRAVIAALVRIRKEKRITQVQLADALGVPQSFISKVERGERRLDIAELLHFCEILDVSIPSLVSIIPARFSAISS